MSKPIAVVVGFAGKLPLAGMALANLHTMAGLVDLGYHVHYVERQNGPESCYDPATNSMTDDPSVAVNFLASTFPRYGFSEQDYSFLDLGNRCHGSGWPRLRDALDRADFVLDMGDASWFDELERCPRRAFIDVDPMFTQLQILSGDARKADTTRHYPVAFTHGVRIGKPDCTMPAAGRHWIPARTAVATSYWSTEPSGEGQPITTLMNWTSGRELTFEGRTYGFKNREFERIMALPSRTKSEVVVAMGGNAPRERLSELGWHLTSPIAATKTIEAYQQFIAGSSIDLGIAKHAYVESQCGWFSDRSTCYMAAGRPVIHQDTGLADWLPVGEGVLAFRTLDEAVDAVERIAGDYTRHARAARRLAAEYFEASTVLAGMLRDAGWRA